MYLLYMLYVLNRGSFKQARGKIKETINWLLLQLQRKTALSINPTTERLEGTVIGLWLRTRVKFTPKVSYLGGTTRSN